jgi:hypothetical protein
LLRCDLPHNRLLFLGYDDELHHAQISLLLNRRRFTVRPCAVKWRRTVPSELCPANFWSGFVLPKLQSSNFTVCCCKTFCHELTRDPFPAQMIMRET